MIRKYMKKKIAYHPELFAKSYQDIRVQSKKCYIATYCFGDQHNTTKTLRDFKKILLNSDSGHLFIKNYYRYSPKLIFYFEKHPIIGNSLSKSIFKPILSLFAFLLRKFIL